MAFVDPPRPFGVAWVSELLYRKDSSAFDEFLGEWAEVAAELGGTAVMIDGWDDALDTAWEELVVSSPDVAAWVDAYSRARDAAGHSGLTVVFNDVTRVTGRAGHGAFAVSYPTSLLISAVDQVDAMRTAIVTVLDRHVAGGKLDVASFSTIVQRTETKPTR